MSHGWGKVIVCEVADSVCFSNTSLKKTNIASPKPNIQAL